MAKKAKRAVKRTVKKKPAKKATPTATRGRTTSKRKLSTAVAKVPKKKRSIARRRARAPELPVVHPEPLGVTPQHGLGALGLSRHTFTADQRRELGAEFKPEQYGILPTTGVIYVSHVYMRQRLNLVFGQGAWGMNPADQPKFDGARASQTFDLFINGLPVGRDMGEAVWVQRNPNSTKVKALSGAQSSALTKICGKVLGMGLECWDKNFQYQFRMKHGVFVRVQTKDGVESQWRSLHQPPIEREIELDARSPNRDKYQAPTAASRVASRGYRPNTPTDDRAESEEHRRAAASTAMVPSGTINGAAIGQLGQAMKAHNVTVVDFKAYLKKRFGHVSRAQILKTEFKEAIGWLQSPDDPPAVEGEVVE